MDTLKVKATDILTLRKSIRRYQVAGFMKSQHVDLMALQEPRLQFDDKDSILHRQLFLNGISLHLMSGINGYNGMAFLSTKPLSVQMISDRIMSGHFILGETKACIYNVGGGGVARIQSLKHMVLRRRVQTRSSQYPRRPHSKRLG